MERLKYVVLFFSVSLLWVFFCNVVILNVRVVRFLDDVRLFLLDNKRIKNARQVILKFMYFANEWCSVIYEIKMKNCKMMNVSMINNL